VTGPPIRNVLIGLVIVNLLAATVSLLDEGVTPS
jgi:hypothetical protein